MRPRDRRPTRKDLGKPYGPYVSLDFGKYAGSVVQAVIERDPDYLLWCLDNVRGFELTEEALVELDCQD